MMGGRVARRGNICRGRSSVGGPNRHALQKRAELICRHELPQENGLQKQNLQDRYYGRNDPVAKKMLSAAATEKGLTPPTDQTVVSD